MDQRVSRQSTVKSLAEAFPAADHAQRFLPIDQPGGDGDSGSRFHHFPGYLPGAAVLYLAEAIIGRRLFVL